MSDLTIMSVKSARRNVVRARKELERARIMDTHYRGVEYTPASPIAPVHGTFVYRGRTYTK